MPRRFQYSLAGLVTFVLWIGSLLGLWMLRQPWVPERELVLPSTVYFQRYAISPDGVYLAASDTLNALHIWRTDDWSHRSVSSAPDGVTPSAIEGCDLGFSSDSQRLAVSYAVRLPESGYTENATVWDLATLQQIKLQDNSINCFVPSLSLLADGRATDQGDEEPVRVNDALTGKLLLEVYADPGWYCLSPTGRRLMSWARDEAGINVCIHNCLSGQTESTVAVCEGTRAAFAGDDLMLTTNASEGRVVLRDLNGREVCAWPLTCDEAEGRVSPDGSRLVLGCHTYDGESERFFLADRGGKCWSCPLTWTAARSVTAPHSPQTRREFCYGKGTVSHVCTTPLPASACCRWKTLPGSSSPTQIASSSGPTTACWSSPAASLNGGGATSTAQNSGSPWSSPSAWCGDFRSSAVTSRFLRSERRTLPRGASGNARLRRCQCDWTMPPHVDAPLPHPRRPPVLRLGSHMGLPPRRRRRPAAVGRALLAQHDLGREGSAGLLRHGERREHQVGREARHRFLRHARRRGR